MAFAHCLPCQSAVCFLTYRRRFGKEGWDVVGKQTQPFSLVNITLFASLVLWSHAEASKPSHPLTDFSAPTICTLMLAATTKPLLFPFNAPPPPWGVYQSGIIQPLPLRFFDCASAPLSLFMFVFLLTPVCDVVRRSASNL
jgi:hypothetical protein